LTNFKTFLSNLVKSCNGLYGATIMGFDGITLSKYFSKELPLSPDVFEALIADYSPLVKGFHEKSYNLDLGKTKNITATMNNVSILFKVLNNNYFLAVISSQNAYLGKIDYYSSIEAKKFQAAFDV